MKHTKKNISKTLGFDFSELSEIESENVKGGGYNYCAMLAAPVMCCKAEYTNVNAGDWICPHY